MSMLGKASVTAAFTTSYVYTLELFPTGVRNNAMGSASMFARVSGMAAPYMGRPLVGVNDSEETYYFSVRISKVIGLNVNVFIINSGHL